MAHEDVAIVTKQWPWTPLSPILDATASAADSALGVAERSFASARALTSNFCYWEVPAGMNLIEVRFKLATDNHDVDIDVWACREWGDDMRRVCTLDVINGTQDVGGSSTLHYADTINISNNKWLKTVGASVPGAEHQATLFFDPCGYKYIGWHGYGTFDGDCTVEVSGCS